MNLKSIGCLLGLIALCVLKAALVWTIWCGVVGALALIGAARVVLGVAQPGPSGRLTVSVFGNEVYAGLCSRHSSGMSGVDAGIGRKVGFFLFSYRVEARHLSWSVKYFLIVIHRLVRIGKP